MKKKDLKIVFMGTPDFAVESLRVLVENDYNIVGVVTMPDKPMGRGHKVQASPIKQFALKNNLYLLQPESLKDTTFIQNLRSLNADIQIVVAFRMLPEIVWNMPPLGTINLHASLLPQYRGAAPINWAIINGEKETGITTFRLKQEIDTGNILFQEKIAIGDNDNAEIIHDKLMILGAQLVIKTVNKILDGTIKGQPQEISDKLNSAPKIFKETCKINWNMTCCEIHNFVRGLSPYPTAWSEFISPDSNPIIVKIYESAKEEINHSLAVGTIICDGKNYLKIACANGFIQILSLQLANKKRMTVQELLRGFSITEGFHAL
jgi:methionyl-tRNA formyltransferase